MKTLLALSICGLALASCTVPPTFAAMTEQELMDYNKGKPVLQQVYCTKEARTSSRIRKTYCDTVEGWVTYNQRQLMALDTINSPSYSPIRSLD